MVYFGEVGGSTLGGLLNFEKLNVPSQESYVAQFRELSGSIWGI